jgi:hypothetical protein
VPRNLGNLRIDAGSVEELLTDPAGPVGRLIAELDEKAADIARTAVHVFPGTRRSTIWNPATSTARYAMPPGFTRRSIHVHGPVAGSLGGMYGGVNVAAFPAVFLEHRPRGASQMHDRYPFMTTALDGLEGLI